MNENKFPEGWDESKVREIIAYYEGQTEDEAVAEDENGVDPSETIMRIPHDLVPAVRELIAKQHKP